MVRSNPVRYRLKTVGHRLKLKRQPGTVALGPMGWRREVVVAIEATTARPTPSFVVDGPRRSHAAVSPAPFKMLPLRFLVAVCKARTAS